MTSGGPFAYRARGQASCPRLARTPSSSLRDSKLGQSHTQRVGLAGFFWCLQVGRKGEWRARKGPQKMGARNGQLFGTTCGLCKLYAEDRMQKTVRRRLYAKDCMEKTVCVELSAT